MPRSQTPPSPAARVCPGCEHDSLHALGAASCSFDGDGTPRPGHHATPEAVRAVAALALDVWLRFDSPDDEEAEAEANTYSDGDGYRVEWSLTAVGQVTGRWFATYEEASAWLTAEGFADYTS